MKANLWARWWLLVMALVGQACSSGTEESSASMDSSAEVVDVGGDRSGGDGMVVGDGGEVVECIPDCEGKICGDDGCDGSCGTQPPGVSCTPDCSLQECGSDGSGGFCGNGNPDTEGCPWELECVEGLCVDENECYLNCDGVECGPDGCGGACGVCPCESCEPTEIYCIDGQCRSNGCGFGDACICIFECFETCDKEDQVCFQNCVNSATIEAQFVYNSLINCLDQSCYYFDDCPDNVWEECQEEYLACFHGDLSCVEMYLFMLSCPPGEEAHICTSEIQMLGTIEAQKSWLVIIDCLELNGYFDCPVGNEGCLEETWMMCDVVTKECLHGEDSCAGILECLESSYAEDPINYESCVLWGTVEAQSLYQEVADCIAGECGEEPTVECTGTALSGTCSGVLESCLAKR
jgi:hypothetical protein